MTNVMICAVCGEKRGPLMCPNCWRNSCMQFVKKWKNSEAFMKKFDKDFEESMRDE